MHYTTRNTLNLIPFILAMYIVIGGVVSCAVSDRAPQSINEAAALSLIAIETAAESIEASLRAGTISTEQAKALSTKLKRAHELVMLAQEAGQVNHNEASGYLRLASDILTSVEARL